MTTKTCEFCEERPAELMLVLADSDGVVLDTTRLCRGCFANAGSLRSVLSPGRPAPAVAPGVPQDATIPPGATSPADDLIVEDVGPGAFRGTS
jgi:hypothetical protein